MEFRDIKGEGMRLSTGGSSPEPGARCASHSGSSQRLGSCVPLAKLMMEDADSECAELLRR